MDSKKLITCIVIGNLITVAIISLVGKIGYDIYFNMEQNRIKKEMEDQQERHLNYLKSLREEIEKLQEKEEDGTITFEEKVRLRYLEKNLRESYY
jgi:hypothetical protein